MKLLFLDVDGVLVNKRMDFDLKAIKRVERILAETGTEIILSSSWRHNHLDEVKKVFPIRDITPSISPVHDIVPMVMRVGALSRTWEILEYLRTTDVYVENFIVIDDSNMPAFGPRMILTQFHELLTDEQTERAIQVLSR